MTKMITGMALMAGHLDREPRVAGLRVGPAPPPSGLDQAERRQDSESPFLTTCPMAPAWSHPAQVAYLEGSVRGSPPRTARGTPGARGAGT